MKAKLFSRTLATVALGAFCIGGTTVFAENLVTKLNSDDATTRTEAKAVQDWSSIASAVPIQFDLGAGWDLQRPQATLAIARSEDEAQAAAIAAAQAAADAQAALDAAAALAAQQAAAAAAVPAAKSASVASKQAPIVQKAKTMAASTAAKTKAATVQAQSAPVEAQTLAVSGASVQDHQGVTYSYKKVLNGTASAYSGAPEENGGYGAVDYYGNALALGTIAVDPKVIPLGSKVLVKGYSFSGLPQTLVAKAADVGGAIKGNKIDIFIPGSRSYVSGFGLQNVQIYVLN